jgi:hypothetical protein
MRRLPFRQPHGPRGRAAVAAGALDTRRSSRQSRRVRHQLCPIGVDAVGGVTALHGRPRASATVASFRSPQRRHGDLRTSVPPRKPWNASDAVRIGAVRANPASLCGVPCDSCSSRHFATGRPAQTLTKRPCQATGLPGTLWCSLPRKRGAICAYQSHRPRHFWRRQAQRLPCSAHPPRSLTRETRHASQVK